MVLFKKFKVILIFLFKRNLFSNFFVTSCNLHKINKYLPFNLFFLNYRKCPKNYADRYIEPVYLE